MTDILNKLAPYAKAVVAAAVGAFVPFVSVSLLDGGPDLKAAIAAVLTAVLTSVAVLLKGNAPSG